MSLLFNGAYANPNTPLWTGGGGGGGSNVVIPVGGQITFQGSPVQVLSNPGLISVLDASANFAPFGSSDLRAYDNVGSYVAVGTYSSNPLGLRAFFDDGSLQNTFAQFDSGGWDLSNVKSVNGVPYFNAPGTQYSYTDYPGGVDISGAPAWGPLNTITFTPPVNGKLFLQSHGTFVPQVMGGAVAMTFAVNGSNIADAPSIMNAYSSNTNVFNTVFTSFPVSQGVPLTIQSVAQRSVIPPEPDTDAVVTSSRMFLSFSPQ